MEVRRLYIFIFLPGTWLPSRFGLACPPSPIWMHKQTVSTHTCSPTLRLPLGCPFIICFFVVFSQPSHWSLCRWKPRPEPKSLGASAERTCTTLLAGHTHTHSSRQCTTLVRVDSLVNSSSAARVQPQPPRTAVPVSSLHLFVIDAIFVPFE